MFAIPRIKDICVLSFIGLIAAADIASAPVFAQETTQELTAVQPIASAAQEPQSGGETWLKASAEIPAAVASWNVA